MPLQGESECHSVSLLARKVLYAASGGEIPTTLVSFRFTEASKESLKNRQATDVDGERRKHRWDLRVTSRKHLLKNIKLSRVLVGTFSSTAISTAPARCSPLFSDLLKGLRSHEQSHNGEYLCQRHAHFYDLKYEVWLSRPHCCQGLHILSARSLPRIVLLLLP